MDDKMCDYEGMEEHDEFREKLLLIMTGILSCICLMVFGKLCNGSRPYIIYESVERPKMKNIGIGTEDTDKDQTRYKNNLRNECFMV
jgi:hypothetical protein